MEGRVKVEASDMIWDEYTEEALTFARDGSKNWLTIDLLKDVYGRVIKDLEGEYSDCFEFDEYGDMVGMKADRVPESVVRLINHMFHIRVEPKRVSMQITITGTARDYTHLQRRVRQAMDEMDMEVTIEQFMEVK
jgi:hypothetical protein